MRKIIVLLCLFFVALGAHAYDLDTTATYIYSSDHNQARIGTAVPIGLTAQVGLEGKYVEDKQGGLKNPVYSVYLPTKLDFELFRLHITPFYYFKNDPHQADFEKMSAYGLNTQVLLSLVQDDAHELYSQGFIGVSYARQKANIHEDAKWNSENYDQFAFTLGLRQNFYHAFLFQVSGTVFQYPDGISRVDGFQGILDTKDLAFSESFDVNRSLAKYALSARFARLWIERKSSLYFAYHYMESHTADPEHSMVIGNSFYMTRNSQLDVAYNHLQDSHGHNKRDLLYANVTISF